MEFQIISAIIWKQPHIFLNDHILYKIIKLLEKWLNIHEHGMKWVGFVIPIILVLYL